MGHQENAGQTNTMARLRAERAQAIATSGGLEQALSSGALPRRIDTTLSEAVVLGLLRQQVTRFLCVLGHGSTEIAEVLRIYEDAKLLKTFNVRHETAASHAAAALRWVTGERAAVVTSIGPGALQALAGSLVPASDGLGVWYLFGDETTEDEGANMQQIPKHDQNLFLRLCATFGTGYSLHTPGAVGTALRRGLVTVDNPHRPGPFYLLLPMNTQAAPLEEFNLDELPLGIPPRLGAASAGNGYREAAEALINAERVVVKVGGGARDAGPEIAEFLDLIDGVAVLSPLVTGVIPYAHPRNMLVGGSKGTLCGNFAMEEADLLVAIGTRSVCQSDSSRTGYPKVTHVININSDVHDAMHYSKTTALVGDAGPTLVHLMNELKQCGVAGSEGTSSWLARCQAERDRWTAYKQSCYQNPTLYDEVWKEEVLTQPVVIKAATDWARAREAVTFFDAGDVQAHGFQIVEDDRLGRTFTETGASYMGFATSALLATALASQPFYGLALTGDGSFTMNPQILIDGVEHGVRGCVLLLDNRRMAAISALQVAQYQQDHATNDSVEVDYIAWARSIKGVAGFDGGRSEESLLNALDRAFEHPGLSLVSVPVYYGPDPRGGLGAYGRWNVGNWVAETQALRHTIGL
jgi:3D-(3,5/4)-trihydroxycyclohexane-1,2-dione acylhydrolase (decyclizing)